MEVGQAKKSRKSNGSMKRRVKEEREASIELYIWVAPFGGNVQKCERLVINEKCRGQQISNGSSEIEIADCHG